MATRLSNQRPGTTRARPLIGQGTGTCDVVAARALSLPLRLGLLCVDGVTGVVQVSLPRG